MIEEEQILEILERCCKSTRDFALTFFPEKFFRKFSRAQEMILEILDDKSIKRVAITGFRGCGKSTLIGNVFPVKEALFEDDSYIVPIGASEDMAIMQCENIKSYITENELIKKMFGNIASKDTFSKELWEIEIRDNFGSVSKESYFHPRGSGQSIRGLNIKGRRPNLAIGDDIMNPEKHKTKEQRKSVRDWYMGSVLKFFDDGIGGPNWRTFLIGTITGSDDLMLDFSIDSNWTYIEIPLCDDKFKSYWYEYATDEMVAKQVAEHRLHETMDIFYREMMCKPIADENKKFIQQYFRRYKEGDVNLSNNRNIENVVIIEPAKTVKKSSDDTSIIGIAIDLKSNRYYVRDVDAGRYHPDEIYDKAFNMAIRIGARVIGYEETSLNEFITYPLTNEMIRRGLFFHLIPLSPRGGHKEDRIMALLPLYRQGLIYHNETCCGGLEAQLLSFSPNDTGKKDDIIDSLSYMIPLMEEGSQYFEPKMEDIEDYKELEKDEYEDEPIDGLNYDNDGDDVLTYSDLEEVTLDDFAN